MEKKVETFLGNLECFFLSDDAARWKAIGWIILLVGTAGSVDLALLNSPLDETVPLMAVFALLLSLGWIAWYCSFRRSREVKPNFISRRAWILEMATIIAAICSLRIPVIEAARAERKLEQNALDPLDPKTAQETEQVLNRVAAANIRLHPKVVEQAGKRFIEASDKNLEVWSTAQQYLDYRSFLNANFVPTPGQLTKWKDSKYKQYINTRVNPDAKLPAKAFTIYFAGGYTPPEKSARLENIDNPQSESSGVGIFVLDGGVDGIVLDHAYLKNVIVRNSAVYYEGGETRLENVYFVNCTFHFELTPKARELGTALLSSASVTFDSRSA